MLVSALISIIFAVLRLVAEVFLVLLLPTFAFRWIRKDLPVGACFAASLLTLLLPLMALLSVYGTNVSLNLMFSAWGVPELNTFWILSWCLGSGAAMAAFYAGVLLLFSRQRSTPLCAVFFTALSYALILLSFTIVPRLTFGYYGWRIASDNTVILSIYGVVAAAVMIYIRFSDVRTAIYKE